jgi:hypothetical protein
MMLPGSHALGVKRRFRRRASGEGTEFEPPEAEEWDLTGSVPLEVSLYFPAHYVSILVEQPRWVPSQCSL